MKLIVGLGNPGSEYRGTRHNVGFEVVDKVARRWNIVFHSAPAEAVLARSSRAFLAKPLTFMNRSGLAVSDLQHYYRVSLSDLLIVTDDVNLPLGRLRARRQGSPGGHNGLRSVIESLGTQQFSRLRIGVGRGDPGRRLTGRVLSKFNDGERPEIDDAVGYAATAVDLFVDFGIESMMNEFNQHEVDEVDGDKKGK